MGLLHNIMATIVYAKQVEDTTGTVLDVPYLKEFFSDASEMLDGMEARGLRCAYFFIDPLMDVFESGNRFYFKVLGRQSVPKISYFRSGAGPIHALDAARGCIDGGRYDAVAIFAYEPLRRNKDRYGKDAINQAMRIFDDCNLIRCYDELGAAVARYLGIGSDEFCHIADALYENYGKTYAQRFPDQGVRRDRGRVLSDLGSDHFRLTDCANPNIDYSGGLILCSDAVYEEWNRNGTSKIDVLSTAVEMVEGDPNDVSSIAGTGDDLFPHLARCAKAICRETGLQLDELVRDGRILLNAYTCYPPIPLAFLVACGFADDVPGIESFLREHEITVDGGISRARAPWNCPAFRAVILMNERLKDGGAAYGLVHGNGGMGETQGLALLSKDC